MRFFSLARKDGPITGHAAGLLAVERILVPR
jgi:hypothetical protein